MAQMRFEAPMVNSRDYTSPYVYQEYPKWVTLADGSQLIVNNADEEKAAIGAPEPTSQPQQPATTGWGQPVATEKGK